MIYRIVILFFLLPTLFLSGCNSIGKSREVEKTVNIIYSAPDMSDVFNQYLTSILQEYSKTKNIELKILDSKNSYELQEADLRTLVHHKPDAIIIDPVDGADLEEFVNDSHKNNIEVMTIDRSLPELNGKIAHFGVNNYEAGVLVGNEIINMFPKTAKIAIVLGQIGVKPHDERLRGLHETLVNNKYQAIILFEEEAKWKQSKAQEVIESELPKYEKPDVVIALNDVMALGILDGLKNLNYSSKDIKIFSFDGLPFIYPHVKNGDVYASVDMKIKEYSISVIDAILKYVTDKLPISSNIISPSLITKQILSETTK